MKKIKLQVALDRISLEEGISTIAQGVRNIDIIEIGTSLLKTNGMKACLDAFHKAFPHSIVLADMKTCDDAYFECTSIFAYGADYTTVMGTASLETITTCQKIAKEFGKSYVIDLLEVDEARISLLKQFEDAVFCIHLSKDKKQEIDQSYVKHMCGLLGENARVAVAGGINLAAIEKLKQIPQIEIIIVGSAITKAENVIDTIWDYQTEIGRKVI